jgi:CheY-like chemotaxis protein
VLAGRLATLPHDTARAEDSGFDRYLTRPVKLDERTATLDEIFLQPR